MRLVQILTTLFVAVLVPVYYIHNGLFHFLWLSDIAFFLTLATLWKESPRLFSATLLYAFPFETAWNVDFIVQLVTGTNLMGIADYMFTDDEPWYLRALSLFHIYMFIIWIWLLRKWGYHASAYVHACGLWLCTVPLSYWLTAPDKNVNWVFLMRELGVEWMPEWMWPLLLMVLIPTVVYPPCHRLLKHWAPRGV